MATVATEETVLNQVSGINDILNAASQNQTEINASLIKLNTTIGEIFKELQLFQYQIALKIIECCKESMSPTANPEETSAQFDRIAQALVALSDKANTVTVSTARQNQGLDQINEETERLKNLFASAKEFINTFNCENCTDETKIKQIEKFIFGIQAIYIKLNNNENSYNFIKSLIPNIPADFSNKYPPSGVNTDPALQLQFVNEIYQLLLVQLYQNGKITEANRNTLQLHQIALSGRGAMGGRRRKSQMRGRRRHKRSLKRPRKRRGSRSSSRRAPPRRTRKYRTHRYAR